MLHYGGYQWGAAASIKVDGCTKPCISSPTACRCCVRADRARHLTRSAGTTRLLFCNVPSGFARFLSSAQSRGCRQRVLKFSKASHCNLPAGKCYCRPDHLRETKWARSKNTGKPTLPVAGHTRSKQAFCSVPSCRWRLSELPLSRSKVSSIPCFHAADMLLAGIGQLQTRGGD